MKINEKNLIAFSTVKPYDHEGFLLKRGDVNKALQRRYFILKGNLLFYFEKKDDREPLGLVLLEGCTIELSSIYNDSYCFEIAFEGNRSYILCAESEEIMNSWMHALARASYIFKRLEIAHLQQQLNVLEDAQNKCMAKLKPANEPPVQPPPRLNPFDRTSEPVRPAPPPPTNGQLGFKEEHFLVSTPEAEQSGIIPQPYPRTKKGNLRNKTEDVPMHKTQQSAVLQATRETNKQLDMKLKSRSKDALTFEELHGHLFNTIMANVIEYRRKNYRLIDF